MRGKTVNGKYWLVGVGRVYNCTCTGPKENNTYHHLDCASRHNLTLTYALNWLERMHFKKIPTWANPPLRVGTK